MPASARVPRFRRSILVLMSVGVVVAVSANFVLAQEYPSRTGDLDTSSGAVVAPGETVTVRGSGFAPGAAVVVTIESDPIVLARTGADGTGAIAASAEIPISLPAGSHTLKATGAAAGGGVLVLAQAVEVTGSAESADGADGVSEVQETVSGGELAFTGLGSVMLLVAAAVVLLFAGGGLIVASRRRRVRSL